MIEIGRYNQTTTDNRHCPFCGSNLIEDEVHFLFHCPTYSMIRNNFYYKVKTLISNITQLPIQGLINGLMNSPNYFIKIQFIKYISACFDVCDKLLSSNVTGHFRVPLGLCIKTRLSAQPVIWKWFFILMQIKLIFTTKGCALRGFSELRSGLLPYDVVLIPKNSFCNTVSASTCMVMQIKLVVVLR